MMRGRYYLPVEGVAEGGTTDNRTVPRASSSAAAPARQRQGRPSSAAEPPGRPGQGSLPSRGHLPPSGTTFRRPELQARASWAEGRDPRRNPDETPPTANEVRDVATDVVKEGRVDEAVAMLKEQAGLPDSSIVRIVFAAIGELAETDVKTARRLFKAYRATQRDAMLPSNCYRFVRFDLHTVWRDMQPVVDVAIEYFTKDEVEKTTVEGCDVFLVTNSMGGNNADQALVVRDSDVAEAIAIERVKRDLEENPEIFNQDFLERFIDQGKLVEQVREIAYDRDWVEEEARRPKQFWQVAEQYDVYDPDEYETEETDFEPPDITDDWIDKVADAIADDRAGRPRQYLSEIMTDEQVTQWIMDNVGIDEQAAAEAAVSEDGAGRYLSSWDNELHETSSGFVYWLE